MDIKNILLIALYIGLIVLIIVSIILLIKVMKTLKRVDQVVDNVENKVNKLNGLFEIIDTTTDVIASFSGHIVTAITTIVSKIFNRKRGKKDE